MLNQEDIAQTSFQAKFYADVLLNKLTTQTANGENIEQCRNQFILLCKWIEILDDYYETHYDTSGDITPDFDCLTLEQILELVASVKVMLGSFKYLNPSDWILATGVWVDGSFWRDSAFWIDSPIV